MSIQEEERADPRTQPTHPSTPTSLNTYTESILATHPYVITVNQQWTMHFEKRIIERMSMHGDLHLGGLISQSLGLVGWIGRYIDLEVEGCLFWSISGDEPGSRCLLYVAIYFC